MCGIAGVVSSYLTDSEKAVFCDLLRVNTLRGSHSTGIMAAFRAGKTVEYMVGKTTRNAVSALDLPSADVKAIFERKTPCTALIGHTRAATRGSIKIGNAHPFIFPRVIGIHNGTISTDLIHEKEYETDSEALYRDINERGLVAALKEINKGYPGYALVMFDKEKDQIVAIRNPRRPLHFTFNKDQTTMFFSSEAGALRYVLGRHNLLYKEQVYPLLKEDVAMLMPVTFNVLKDMVFKQLDVKNKVTVIPAASPIPRIAATQPVPQQSAITLASTVVPEKKEASKDTTPKYQAPNGMSKSQRKKFTKQLRKQAKVSAMLAKQAADEAEESESTGFTKESTPGFLKSAGIKASKRIRKHFKSTPITEDGKSAVLHQSALFEDVQDFNTQVVQHRTWDSTGNSPDICIAVADQMAQELRGTLGSPPLEPDMPFDDPLPWEDDPIDPDEDGDCDPNAGYIGAYGDIIPRETMEELLAKGCAWCSQAEELQYHERVEWVDRTQYVCAECMDTNEDIKAYFGHTATFGKKPTIN